MASAVHHGLSMYGTHGFSRTSIGKARLPACGEPPAGVSQLASYVDVKVPAKYWVDMIWQDGEWRPAGTSRCRTTTRRASS